MARKKFTTVLHGVRYDRKCKDYAVYVNGQYIGSRAEYLKAETLFQSKTTALAAQAA